MHSCTLTQQNFLYVFFSKSLCISHRFVSGLSSLGVVDAVKRWPAVMREAFVYVEKPLNASTVELVLPIVNWSLVGSNRHNAEKRTQTQWRDFLQDLEGMKIAV
jgi:hypothetical protein